MNSLTSHNIPMFITKLEEEIAAMEAGITAGAKQAFLLGFRAAKTGASNPEQAWLDAAITLGIEA